MKNLQDYTEIIRSCSKCGLCQAACPIYKASGNDCTVSRGLFTMLHGYLKGDLKNLKIINKYIDLCFKCNLCSKACPTGIDVVKILFYAKQEYFKKSFKLKLKSFVLKYIFMNFLNVLNIFSSHKKSEKFDKKVLFFGGCGTKLRGNSSIVKLMNKMGYEVITPNFSCCGMPYLNDGNLNEVKRLIKNFVSVVKNNGINEIVVNCASCENVIKNYIEYTDNDEEIEFLKNIKINNIFYYINKSDIEFKLKKTQNVTYHKPCNLESIEEFEQCLNKISNLNYTRVDNIDLCCGLLGLENFKEYKNLFKIYKEKRNSLINTGAKNVLTSCLGCEVALSLYSFGKYKTFDFVDFLAKNLYEN